MGKASNRKWTNRLTDEVKIGRQVNMIKKGKLREQYIRLCAFLGVEPKEPK